MNRLKLITFNACKMIKNNWIIYIAGIVSILVIIAILFAIPMKKVTVQNTATYYDIEKTSEPYTDLEPYISYSDNSKSQILIEGFFQVVPNGTTVPFTIDRANSRITGHFENSIPGRFAILGIGDRVIWETMGSRDIINLSLEPGDYKALFKEDVMWGEDCYIFLTAHWGELEPMIEYREITKYREVAIEVEKEQIIEQQIMISIWNYLFQELPLLK